MRTLAWLVAAGCLTDLGPPVGAPVRASCVDADSDPATMESYRANIAPLWSTITDHCADCHTPAGKSPIGIEDSGLDLSSYDTLIAGGTRSGSAIVIAGMPCESVLIEKLGDSPPFGARMPLDGPPFLDATQMQVLADWIAEGAANN